MSGFKNSLKRYTACSVLICCGLILGLIAVNSDRAQAASGINQQLNFQGRLFGSTGAVIPDGDYNMEFKIVQDGDGCNPTSGTFPCSGTVDWTETRTSSDKVTVTNGYFSVNLGSVTSLPTNIWNLDTLWLSINIGGTGSPSWDGEMKPLKRLSSSPYALNSGLLGGLAASNFVQLAQGVQTDSSTANASIAINKTGGTAGILDLQRGGSSVFSIANNGAALFQNASDSATALQVKNLAGKAVATVNTSDNTLVLGKAGGSGLDGGLVFNNATNSNTIKFIPGVTSSSYTLTLPTALPGSTQCLQSDNTGVLSFSACSGGGGGNSFETIDAPSGTDPVADSATDTLQLLVTGSNLTITGADNPETLTFDIDESVLAGAGLVANSSALDIGAGTGISVAANAISIDQSASLTWTSGETFNGGLSLAPTSTSDVVFAGDNDSNFQIASTFTGTGPSISMLDLTLTDNATAAGTSYGLSITNADNSTNLGVPAALAYLKNANAAETVADGLLVEQTGAGTLTSGLDVKQTAGAITNGLTFSGTFTKLINSTNFNVLNSGALSAASIDAGSGLIQTTGSVYGNTLDRSTSGTLGIGTGNSSAITLGGSSTVSTAAGGLTVTTGKSFTVNGDALTDLTGNGLVNSSGALTVGVAASADALSATTSSGSGMEVLASGVTLLQGCSDGQILKWNETTDVWACGADSGGGGTLAAAYAGGSSQTDSTIALDSTRLGVRIQDASSPISGSLFAVQSNAAGATFLGVSTTAVTLQDSSGNNALIFDSANSILKVFENVSTPSNYAQLYYSSGEAVFAASSGTTRVGSGSGNISMSLTGNSDVLTFSKTSTPVATYSLTDFKVTRNLTGGSNALQGSVFKVEDLSTYSGGSSTPDVVAINQNNSGATGNLINAQLAGSSKFSVTTAGTVSIAAGQSYTGAGAVTLSSTSSGLLTLQGAGGISLTASGSNNIVLGTADSTGTLLVLDTKNDNTTDPTGVNGGMYYNSTAGKNRCYENSVWRNCVTTNPVGVVAVLTSDVAIANTETQVLGYTIPANTSAAGDTYKITAYASRSGANGTAPTIRVRVGTTTLTGNIAATLTGTANTTAATRAYTGLITIRSTGGAGTVGGGLGETITGQASAVSTTSTVAVDTTANKIIELTFISGSATNTYTFSYVTIEKLSNQ